MKKAELRRRKKGMWAILLVLLMYSPIVNALTITTPAGPLLDGSAFPGLSYNVQLTADEATGLTWQLKLGFGDLPPGLTLSSSGLISGTPQLTAAGKTFSFTAQVVNGSSQQAEATFTITIIRLPVDVMLVLDNSISMDCCYDKMPPDPTCVSCATAVNSRMARLKIAVDKFFTLGMAGTKPYFHTSNGEAQFNDRFGAVIFCGTLDASKSSYAGNTPSSLNTYIQGITTGSGTCIGGGLLSGIDNMKTQAATNHNKSLILFTDGEQNYNPMLKDAGGAPVKYEAGDLPIHPYDPSAPNPPYGSCMPFPATTPIFDNAFRNTNPAIKVSTIGFELPAGPGNQLLADLADPISGAGGTTNISGSLSAGVDDFTTFFTNAFVELLSGNSPQIVKEVNGVTASGTNRVSFRVNDTLTKISFMLSGNTGAGDTLQFRVLKDSVDVTRLGSMVHRNSYNLWTLDIPFRPSGIVPSSFKIGGEWVLQTTQVPNIRYVATCIVDDHLLDYKCSFGGSSSHVVGSPIPLKVTLSYKNKPLKDSARVVVFVQRTTDDGGTQLALLPTPQQLKTLLKAVGDKVDPGYNNLGQLKHYTLLQTEQKYRQTLTPAVDSVVLTNNGDGTWSGSYDPKVTGVYKFTYLIDGQDSVIGTYQRTAVKSSVVSLSHFDLSSSNIKMEEINANGTLTGYKITLLLKDSSGLLKGPAFGSSLGLQTNSGKFGPVTDNLDGTYTFVLTLDNDKNPTIDITVGGKHYYSGPVNSLTSSDGGTSIFGHWWFWLIILLILILIFWAIRKKKP